MAKKKLIHFAENLTFNHLFQQSYHELMLGFPLKGKWRSDYFRNGHPVILELGCGKGEYTVNLALRHKDRNFIGMDVKGARLWKGCKMVEDLGLDNVAFIRSRIELLEHFFDRTEVEEIWLTFPDPFIENRRSHRRLTSPSFLEKYRNILAPGGLIHLKTDNLKLYNYTLGIIRDHGHLLVFCSDDIYHLDELHEATAIQTYYEEKYRNENIPIKYIEFRLSDGK